MAPPRAHETRELIAHLRSRRRRQRTGRALAWGLAAIVVLAAVITGLVLLTSGLGAKASGSAPTSDARGSGAAKATTSTTALRYTTTESEKAGPPTSSAAPVSTSTTPAPPTTSAPSTTSTTNWLAAKVVVIDPGHQGRADYNLEPIGPRSSTGKAEVSSGTVSPTTGTPESALNLAVGLKLQAALQAKGIHVIMTRSTQDVDITNVQRAQMANRAHADLAIRLHCNGSTDRSVHGLFTLYPASIRGWTDDVATPSKQAAAMIQKEAIAATGAQDRGLQERSDLTGFNWSDVPVVLVEMGFMTNAAEDKQLESDAYQNKIVQGLVNGIVDFLGTT